MSERAPSTPDALLAQLVALMARLRSPEGCPWDRKQDHRSLRHCLLEECYEVLEAIDQDDPEALRQELGDLFLQVLFHAQLAAEAGRFTIDDVLRALHDKLVHRHPHVFGGPQLDTPDEVLRQWRNLKHEERAEAGNDKGSEVPRALPALSRAQMALRRAEHAVSPRPIEEVRACLEGALARLVETSEGGRDAEQAFGDLLLAAVDLARLKGLDAEQTLRVRLDEFLAELTRQAHGRGPAGKPMDQA